MSTKEHLNTTLPLLLVGMHALWGVYLYFDAFQIQGHTMLLYSFDHDSTWIRTVLGVILFIWLVVSQLKSEHSRIAFSLLVSSFIVNVWRIEEGEALLRGSSSQPIGMEFIMLYVFWLGAVFSMLYFLMRITRKYMFVKKEVVQGEMAISVSRFPNLRGNLVILGLVYPVFMIVYTAVSRIVGDLRVDGITFSLMLASPLLLLAFFAKPSVTWQRKALAFYGGHLLGWMAYGIYFQSMVVCGYGCSSPPRTVAGDSLGIFIFGLVFIISYSLVYGLFTYIVRRSDKKNNTGKLTENIPVTTSKFTKLRSIPFAGAMFTIAVIMLIVINPIHPEKQRIEGSKEIYVTCVGADNAKLLADERSLPTEVESCVTERHVVSGKDTLVASVGYYSNCGDIDCLYTKNFVISNGTLIPIALRPQNPFSHSKNGVDPIRDRLGCDNLKFVDGPYPGLSYSRVSLVFDGGTYRWMLEYDNVPTVDKWGNSCLISGYQIDNGEDVFDYNLTAVHTRILTPAECPHTRGIPTSTYIGSWDSGYYATHRDADPQTTAYGEYENCLSSIAGASRNADICAEIKNLSIRSSCYESVARSTLREELCENMDSDHQYSSQGYCRESVKNFKKHERILTTPN